MWIELVCGVLLLHVSLVSAGTQICQNSDENAYSIITFGKPGKDGTPGINGVHGVKGEKGDTALLSMKQQISSLNSRLLNLQTSLDTKVEGLKKALAFFKGAAKSGTKIFVSNGVEANYNDTMNICAKDGGQLATPQNAEENAAVLNVRNQFGVHAWMGINDIKIEDTYRYLNDEPIIYSNWMTGEPNNNKGPNEDCAEIWDNGGWNDELCNLSRLVICEIAIN
ncbi:pulmonary surfactant-associated protein D-like isoform X2 [Hyperolius riggenbachi]|uniref:pulmonary surfactant-associated protein D-like isoform X2 n=1 Tax=Hyperolius riggenbachi TaxID=752182 RepID=UPI0035A38795